MERGIQRLRVAAAQALLNEGTQVTDDALRSELKGARLLMVAQGTRASHLFESVIALSRIGRGVPAAMLNRALFEEVLEIHWVAANPDIAPELADEHEKLMLLAERDLEEKFDRPVERLSDRERRELKVLVKKYKGFKAAWNLASEAEKQKLIEARWGTAAEDNIAFVYEFIQRQNNLLLHASPTAYGHTMSPDRTMFNRIGPDMRVRDSIGHGGLAYYFVLRVIAEEFLIDKTPLVDAFRELANFSRDENSKPFEGIRASENCPCGSGRTAGACHFS
jgi:hypothetical protein